MSQKFMQEVLILCKTNPTPSSSYIETVCIAGMKPDGSLIRLYPVPFRLLDEEYKFKKWQYINILVEKNPKDHRKESYRVYVDDLKVGKVVDTSFDWKVRRQLLEKIRCYTSMQEIRKLSDSKELSLALLKPTEIVDFEIKPASEQDWTPKQKDALQQLHQMSLFSENNSDKIKLLQKIPYDFYIYFNDDTGNLLKHKIIDWEIGALYWKLIKDNDWQQKMQLHLKRIFDEKDVYFLMGNEKRFQQNWHIISLIYPPKPVAENFTFDF